MCTVTYIPCSGGFYLTSSRDEKAVRPTLPPRKYKFGDIELLCPKDEVGGGTWIATNEGGRVACLLNGAFVNHIRADGYERSRGQVLLEYFQYPTMTEFEEKVVLDNVEPFTLLCLENDGGLLSRFFELRWDGVKKHFKELSNLKPLVWSSATLYSGAAQTRRQELFEKWVLLYGAYEDKNILSFHNNRHGLEKEEDIIMMGTDGLMTLSITQVHVSSNGTSMRYVDLMGNRNYREGFRRKV